MKRLHRKDLYGWSSFFEPLDIDFNSVAWVRPQGNVVIDPLGLSAHDLAHLIELGGAATVVLTSSDHLRSTLPLVERTKATVVGPRAEQATLKCDRYVGDGDEVVPGLVARELDGSKTPGELALVLEESTLITGDLVRSHRAEQLTLLRDDKLKDRAAATASLRRLLALHPRIEAILVGDGWHLFHDGHAALIRLISEPPR